MAYEVSREVVIDRLLLVSETWFVHVRLTWVSIYANVTVRKPMETARPLNISESVDDSYCPAIKQLQCSTVRSVKVSDLTSSNIAYLVRVYAGNHSNRSRARTLKVYLTKVRKKTLMSNLTERRRDPSNTHLALGVLPLKKKRNLTSQPAPVRERGIIDLLARSLAIRRREYNGTVDETSDLDAEVAWRSSTAGASRWCSSRERVMREGPLW